MLFLWAVGEQLVVANRHGGEIHSNSQPVASHF